jgi:preprotein translocase subunit SecF
LASKLRDRSLGAYKMTKQTNKKLTHQAKGVILMFAAIPVIVVIKLYFEDNFALGLAASLLLALGCIEIGKEES